MRHSIVQRVEILLFVLFALALALIVINNFSSTTLNEIKSKSEIVVVTTNSATTYYTGPNGPTGFEYDLAQAFADYLGVELKLIVEDDLQNIVPMMIYEKKAHLSAAGLKKTDQRSSYLSFGPAYQKIVPQLIYRAGTKRPKTLSELAGSPIDVTAETSKTDLLYNLQKEHPSLQWKEHADLDTEDLLRLVAEGAIDFTIADSIDVAIHQRYFPNVRVAFNVTQTQELAWILPKSEDQSLLNEVEKFFAQIQNDGTYLKIYEKHFGHVGDIDYADSHTFIKHVGYRLPKFRHKFMRIANEHDLDWRLLVAISYQESLWNPKAVSPTGVRGLMMLTKDTAKQVKIADRRDPLKSLQGGTAYFLRVKDKIPERIAEPDRTWFALAAYNVGFGHLEDARIITQRLGGDPDTWLDVQKIFRCLVKRNGIRKLDLGMREEKNPLNMCKIYVIITNC